METLTVVRCGTCGLVFLDSAEDETELQGLYTEQYYRERKDYYFGNTVADPAKGEENENIEEFAEGLHNLRRLSPEGKRLLDVGCGVGVFLRMARQDHWQVTGADISSFAAKYGQEQFGLDIRQGTLRSLALPPEAVGVVTMWDLIEHVSDPVAELREAARVVKAGGYLLVNTPNEGALLKILARISYGLSFGLVSYPVRKLYHIYHRHYFGAKTLARALEEAGFEVTEILRSNIPLVKARGSHLEKAIVGMFCALERALKREYQLMLIARKP